MTKQKRRLVRTCGTCTMCCTAMGVRELEKPMATPCVHSTGHSCSIYETRPESCRTFECLWLHEPVELPEGRRLMWEAHRPDLCGVMFHATSVGLERLVGYPVIVARGDFEKGRSVINRLARFALVVMVFDDGRRKLTGTPEAIEAGLRYLSDKLGEVVQ